MIKLNANEEKIAVGLIRQSDPHRQAKNHSKEDQERTIRAVAVEMGCSENVKFFYDLVSAYHTRIGDRPGVQEMMDFVLTHPNVWGIFVYDLSRASRQGGSDVYFEVAEILWKHDSNIRFVSAVHREVVDFNNPLTQFQFMQSRMDSEQKAIRAVGNQKSALSQEKRPGSSAPYGMTQKDGKLSRNSNASIVYLIFFLAYWGYSDEHIAAFLTDSQVLPPRNDRKWSSSTINEILHNESYIGWLPWGKRHRVQGQFIPTENYPILRGLHDPCIPSWLWYGVQELRSKKDEVAKFTNAGSLLQGMIYCTYEHDAPSLMQRKDNTPKNAAAKYVYYRCPECKKSVRATDVDTLILERLRKEYAIKSEDRIRATNEAFARARRVVSERIDELREELRLVEFKATLKNSNIPQSDIERAKKIVKERLAKQQSELQKLESIEHEIAGLEPIVTHSNVMELNLIELRALCFHSHLTVRVDPTSIQDIKIDLEIAVGS